MLRLKMTNGEMNIINGPDENLISGLAPNQLFPLNLTIFIGHDKL